MGKKDIVDFYAALEVKEEADELAIKKSYRTLVLKWHPDKNTKDRVKAEEQIRIINNAYGVLSNPTKREKYDLQRCAMTGHKRGHVPKPKVSAKMNVPKEFLMQPLGHPEKFLRYNGKMTAIVGRQDTNLNFDDFFSQAKFALWWVPQVNNQCRIRAQGSKTKGDKRGAAAGLAGGLNLSFKVAAGQESEVIMAAAEKGKKSASVDFMVKESPEYEGAFRFETSCRRGHYLAYVAPGELRVVPLLNEEMGRVLDFMLVDFAATLKYKDLDEVLWPIAEPKRGTWIPVKDFIEAKEVATYFKKVLQKPIWEKEDFVAYFEGHWVDWEYCAASSEVRLRPKEERLGQYLRSAPKAADVTMALLNAGEELTKVPLPGLLQAIKHLSEPDANETPNEEGECIGREVERMKLLRALPDALTACVAKANEEGNQMEVSVKEMIDAAQLVPALVCKNPLPHILEHRKDSVRNIVELVTLRVQALQEKDPSSTAFTAAQLLDILGMHGASAHDDALAKVSEAAVRDATVDQLVHLVQRATPLGCERIAEIAVGVATQRLDKSDADECGRMVEVLANVRGSPSALAAPLRRQAETMSVQVLSSATVALISREAAPSEIEQVIGVLAKRKELASVELPTILALALAASRTTEYAALVDPIVRAAAARAGEWETVDAIRLLLIAARGVQHLAEGTADLALESLGAVLVPKVSDLLAADLVKLLLGVVGFGASRLFEAVAKETRIRFPDFSIPHLLMATQGLARGLAPDHPALLELLAMWPVKLRLPQFVSINDAIARKPVKQVLFVDHVTIEQVTKLCLSMLPVLRTLKDEQREAGQTFVEAVCVQLVVRPLEVDELYKPQLKAEVEDGGVLASFSRREALKAGLFRMSTEMQNAKKRNRSPSPNCLYHSHLKKDGSTSNRKKKRQKKLAAAAARAER